VIPVEARGVWRQLEGHLRPYVARRVASPADVDDVVQEVFVRIHRGQVELRDGESFGGWVYRIAQRAVVDHVRSRARHPLPSAEGPEATPDVGAPEPDIHLDADLAECVVLFVARLPSPYREAITLTELEGMTQSEAADMLGVSLSGIESRVQRGRERIRRMFEECCEVSTDARGRVVGCTPRALDEVPEDCRAAAEGWASRREP
jgi:RNA polymerase sigma-70 factor (ECF subfamily)